MDELRDISGVLNINKPAGMTSHDVVNRIRRLYDTKRVGHTGTLDPMATGVLIVLVGRAAKAAEYITSADKRYRAGLKLGITTDTGDITGTILTQTDILPDICEVKKAAGSFTGDIIQIPPMYSALKVNGHKLVDLARKGIEIEREARNITVYSLTAEPRKSDEYDLDVHCSKGTYIRTLCEDIGKALGCGGTMKSLVRISTGNFSINDAYTLGTIEEMTENERIGALLPTEELFAACPTLLLGGFFAKLARSGAEIYQAKINTGYTEGERLRMYDEEGFFALGEVRQYEDGSAVKPIKLFRI
jgi:tRNA pseudouridine55 synthase